MRSKAIIFFSKVNEYCLYLLVFSMVYEYWDPFKFGENLSIAFIAALLYLVSSIPLLRNDFNFYGLRRYMVPLGIFIIVGICSTALNSEYASGIAEVVNIRFVQLVVLTILIANQTGRNPVLIQRALLFFTVAVVSMFFLQLVGIGAVQHKGRLLLFGENPNVLGMKAAIAFLITVYFVLASKPSILRVALGLLAALPLLNLIFLSGSRGALGSVLLGTALLVALMKIGLIKKLIIASIGVVTSLFLITYIMTSEKGFARRIEYALKTRSTGGRSQLWEAAYRIIEDNLVLGVGIPGVLPEMYRYSGNAIDPHNVFLYVLVGTGIIGFFFFMMFVMRLGVRLYQEFKQTGTVIYLVLFLVLLFNMSKAGGGITKIIFWFFFALSIGSTLIEDKWRKHTQTQLYPNENIGNIR